MNEKRKFLPEKEDYLTLNKTNYDKRREGHKYNSLCFFSQNEKISSKQFVTQSVIIFG